MNRCIIISSSPELDISFLAQSVKSNDFIICADGGYRYAYAASLVPNIIIGDFDSAEPPESCASEIMVLPVKKDDTDTFRCVKEALVRGFDDIVIFGGIGGRLDHTYANMSVLYYIISHGARGTLLDTKNEICMLSEAEMNIDGRSGELFSIFPFGCESCVVTLTGFEYTLERGTLNIGSPVGISNVITSDRAVVKVLSGTSAIIFSKD